MGAPSGWDMSPPTEHLHSFRIWRRTGPRWQMGKWWWDHVGTVKAADPVEALERAHVGSGRYLIIHADSARLSAFAAGGDFSYDSVNIIKRGWLQ